MTKDDIFQIIKRNKGVIEDLGYSGASKNLRFGKYKVSFVMSKYGFSEEYGLEFFVRAENAEAPKDVWGNIDMFAEGSSIDLTPQALYDFDKNTKAEVRSIYGKLRNFNINGSRFSAWNNDELESLVLLLLTKFAALLHARGS